MLIQLTSDAISALRWYMLISDIVGQCEIHCSYKSLYMSKLDAKYYANILECQSWIWIELNIIHGSSGGYIEQMNIDAGSVHECSFEVDHESLHASNSIHESIADPRSDSSHNKRIIIMIIRVIVASDDAEHLWIVWLQPRWYHHTRKQSTKNSTRC